MTERQIERWWRYRRAQDKPSTLVKFCENSWRCMYYTYSFTYGVTVLWDKPWFWDVKSCWHGYPHQVSFPSSPPERASFSPASRPAVGRQ